MTYENDEANLGQKLGPTVKRLNRLIDGLTRKGGKYGKDEDLLKAQEAARSLQILCETPAPDESAECSPEQRSYKVDEIPDEIKVRVNGVKQQAGNWCRVFGEIKNVARQCWDRVKGLPTYDQLDPDFKYTADLFIANLIGDDVIANPELVRLRRETEGAYEEEREEESSVSGTPPSREYVAGVEGSYEDAEARGADLRRRIKNRGRYQKLNSGAFGILSDDCAKAGELLLAALNTTSVKELRLLLGRYEARLKDMMISYKGLYDLIKLETSSNQLPPEFQSELMPYLVKPFEFHNGLQKQLIEIEILLANKDAQCLDRLTELSDEVTASTVKFEADLQRIDLTEAPSFVKSFSTGLDDLLRRGGAVAGVISTGAANPSIRESPARVRAMLQGSLDSLIEIRENSFFKIYNELSEGIRLQKILPSWRDRANWVARVKQGLKEFWEGISKLNTEVRICFEEVDDEISRLSDPFAGAPTGTVTGTGTVPGAMAGGQIPPQVFSSVNTIATGVDTLASAGFPGSGSGFGGGGGYVAAGAPALNIDQKLDVDIAGVFGQKLRPPQTTDAEILAFAQKLKSALQRSVVKTPRSGSTVYSLQSRGAVPTNDGGTTPIRGKQATFYQQASRINDLVSDLLDKLVCQLLVCEDETTDLLKDDIRSGVSSIVAEMGRAGGALQLREETIFTALGDSLEALRVALGIGSPLAGQKDMDIAEKEENEGNFALLNNLIDPSLTAAPPSQLRALSGQYAAAIGDARGTLLTNLVRTIESIPYSIQEIYSLMDSVRFGEVDRRSTLIPTTTTTVEQLLSWIEVSATTEWSARLSIGDTRKIEVRAIEGAALGQRDLLDTLIAKLDQVLQTGVNRVGGALSELRRQLNEVSNLAHTIAQ
jgi:hypothetical protein